MKPTAQATLISHQSPHYPWQTGADDGAWALRHAFDTILQRPAPPPAPGAEWELLPLASACANAAPGAPPAGWEIVNDDVMGGASSSWLAASPDGLVFRGAVSAAHGGGFASCRTLPRDLGAAGAAGLAVQFCASDAREWKLVARTDDAWGAPSYSAPLRPQAPGSPEAACVALSDFRPSFRGMPLRGAPPLEGGAIRSVGFMLSRFGVDGAPLPSFAPGPFELLVRSIGAYA